MAQVALDIYLITGLTVLFLFAWAIAWLIAAIVTYVRRLGHEARCPPGHCQRCGYDLRASPASCPECGTATSARAILPSARPLRRVLLLVQVLLMFANMAWPYVVERPALLAEARKDILTMPGVPLNAVRSDFLPVGQVFVVNDAFRLRVVSDSHHNFFIGYRGSTYVNVNNHVYFRSGGHCAPMWSAGTLSLASATPAELTTTLLSLGYRLVDR